MMVKDFSLHNKYSRDNTPAGRPLLSQHPKPLMAIQSSSGFSNLRPGAFHISLQANKTQHTQLRGWKKRRTNNHGLGLALSARRENFVTLWCSFLCICRLLRTCIRAKFPQSHQEYWLNPLRWPTRPLGSLVLAVAFLWPSASFDFCRQLSPADCLGLFYPVLSTALVCPVTLPPLVFFRSRGKSRAQALCVGFAPKQTKGSSGWHPHPHPQKRIPPLMSNSFFLINSNLIIRKYMYLPNPSSMITTRHKIHLWIE